jgi:hypothetical protein
VWPPRRPLTSPQDANQKIFWGSTLKEPAILLQNSALRRTLEIACHDDHSRALLLLRQGMDFFFLFFFFF